MVVPVSTAASARRVSAVAARLPVLAGGLRPRRLGYWGELGGRTCQLAGIGAYGTDTTSNTSTGGFGGGG